MKLSWIDVKDELPPVGIKVLVLTKNGNFAISSVYVHNGKYSWKGSSSFSDSVEKWKYLFAEEDIKATLARKLFTKGIDKHIIDEILKEL